MCQSELIDKIAHKTQPPGAVDTCKAFQIASNWLKETAARASICLSKYKGDELDRTRRVRNKKEYLYSQMSNSLHNHKTNHIKNSIIL